MDTIDTAIAAEATIAAGARNLFKGLLQMVIYYVFIEYYQQTNKYSLSSICNAKN
jgi:hypothetical protein